MDSIQTITALPTPLCISCTRRSLSPCPSLNLIHYKSAGCFLSILKAACTFY
ncbi:hypothetical protein HMPREF0476_1836 [Kingella kingae ATCC 23330]|uniref:Uncharacterized protein n=1 Tax=Kingella kingae ATCC 23330 TaxID=887327 RepID=F5S9F3_KINKI|nr:hypothetical protein HMPREF0476_1836 [Kingella kingae ATCC 23330]